MFGGVAKTYVTWDIKGEPFRDKYWYVIVINPKTGAEKKVRWYSDKAHHELRVAAGKEIEPKFHGKIFGFEDENDHILAIRGYLISDEEREAYFSGKWRYGTFFGGIWYAPKDTPLPPIAKSNKFGKVSWPSFVKAGREMNKKLHDGAETGFWFTVEVPNG